MLSSFPGLTESEFGDGCEALQKRCNGRLDDTDWLAVTWQEGALTIKKSYHVNSLDRPHDHAKTHDSDGSAICLVDVDDEDDV
jgi:hypothetical protein